ncbi:hypothetical protein WICPIJ_008177 [Wickerhamomyces pijperi]|uniref:Uncharacterized protein n=1 Tax=Wickerhamomyces pijperi TaxID=599730 RepID=A0A9P8PZX4_WICPI|nr:hypothetical protein WICPIJ_008177 [Wickerhamomyces pijperi]
MEGAALGAENWYDFFFIVGAAGVCGFVLLSILAGSISSNSSGSESSTKSILKCFKLERRSITGTVPDLILTL